MMSRQAKLALEVLWQEGVKAGDRQDMQHATGRSEHQDVVLQQPLHGFRKVYGRQQRPKYYGIGRVHVNAANSKMNLHACTRLLP